MLQDVGMRLTVEDSGLRVQGVGFRDYVCACRPLDKYPACRGGALIPTGPGEVVEPHGRVYEPTRKLQGLCGATTVQDTGWNVVACTWRESRMIRGLWKQTLDEYPQVVGYLLHHT